MDESINHPYANFFELVMGIIPEAKKLLQHFGDQQLITQLDLDTLKLAHGSYKGGETGLANFITDMLYTCKWQGQEVFIDILLEHKSWRENPKRQILTYLMEGYNRQRLVWKRKREEAKQKGKPLPTDSFKFRPIIAIVFYHGEQPWKDYAFADQFDLPAEWLRDFIPDVKLFVIDMSQFSDADIERIGASFIQPMLYLFKHKADKNYLLQHTEIFFKFVEELTDDKYTRKFLETIFYFMIQTFKLEQEDVEIIKEHLPVKNPDVMNVVEGAIVTVIDEAIQKGLLKGKEIGKEIGEEIGIAKGKAIGKAIGIEKGKELAKIQQTIETIARLVKTVPTMKDEVIAIIYKVEKEWVAKIRKTFQAKSKVTVKKFARSAYEKVPDLTVKEFAKLEVATVKLWEELKK